MANSRKQKGNRGERECCTIFAEEFGGSWIRVPNSGAFVGGKNAQRKNTLSDNQINLTQGDIITPDHMSNLVIEVKNHKDFPFHQLMQNTDVIILDNWIQQTLDVIEEHNFWMICFKINRKGWFIAVPSLDWKLHSYAKYKDYYVTNMNDFIKDNKDKILELSKKIS